MKNEQALISLNKKRHSLAHILLMAIKEHFPNALPTIGPVTDTGFYYDIDFKGEKISPDHLPILEKTMREIITKNLTFKKESISPKEAEELFAENIYKIEIIKNIKEESEDITLYRTGEVFFDLCEGPHVENTEQITTDSFKLTHIAGAYWRGDEKNQMLTRIYGLAFDTKEELEAYELQMEEAKKRDHRILGRQLKLFTFSELVGPGLPLWTPRGTIIRSKIDSYVQELRSRYNYQPVSIPHITKKDLYIKSGHWEKYAEDLFKIETRDGHTYCMKPMNCPHHTQIYASELRSYKELPIRLSETTMVYRDEQSGELSGLSRVLSITQDDAHVFCRESQLAEEIENIWDLIQEFYGTFGFINLTPRFSRRNNDSKFKGADELWEKAESAIRTLITKRSGDTWIDGEGEAAFYGPKVDFMAKDSIDRTWQVGTIQVDFVQPSNFGLECVNEEGKREPIVMIHCAIAGSLERFLSVYIEHVAGNFPLWLSPVQVAILPINEVHHEYAHTIKEQLVTLGIRTQLDTSKEGLGKKIKSLRELKTPYWIVIGDQEMNTQTVTLEHITKGKIGTLSKEEFTELLLKEIREKN
jgi:threonyl-tRNA synthetase